MQKLRPKIECPLCGSNDYVITDLVTLDELRKIWQQIDITTYVKNNVIEICRCKHCCLDFFNPLVSGDGDFYAEVTSGDYYQLSWDYRKIYSMVMDCKIKSIMDYGCGNGDFIKLLPSDLYRVGYDFNAPNIDIENLYINSIDLNVFSEKNKFDMVISVQVLEHVVDIHKHISNMKSCLSDDGILIISVPNRDGIISNVENDFNSLDFIPHHLSRWNSGVLEKIGSIFDMDILGIYKEPLSFEHYKWARNSYFSKAFGNTFKDKILRKIFGYSHNISIANTYCNEKNNIDGHSILGVFRNK